MKVKSKVNKSLEAQKKKRMKEFQKEKKNRWNAKPAHNVMVGSKKSMQWWNK